MLKFIVVIHRGSKSYWTGTYWTKYQSKARLYDFDTVGFAPLNRFVGIGTLAYYEDAPLSVIHKAKLKENALDA
jgi:hypothetical protein